MDCNYNDIFIAFITLIFTLLQALSCAQAAARRQRLDDIRGNPRPRFGYDPWQHPDLREGGGIQQGVFGGVDAGSEAWGAVKPATRNGGEHFLQTKVGNQGKNREFSRKRTLRPVTTRTLNHCSTRHASK